MPRIDSAQTPIEASRIDTRGQDGMGEDLQHEGQARRSAWCGCPCRRRAAATAARSRRCRSASARSDRTASPRRSSAAAPATGTAAAPAARPSARRGWCRQESQHASWSAAGRSSKATPAAGWSIRASDNRRSNSPRSKWTMSLRYVEVLLQRAAYRGRTSRCRPSPATGYPPCEPPNSTCESSFSSIGLRGASRGTKKFSVLATQMTTTNISSRRATIRT